MYFTLYLVFTITSLVLLFAGLFGARFNIKSKLKLSNIFISQRVHSFILGLLTVGIGVWFGLLQTPSEAQEQSVKYGFENGTMGWMPQDYEDSQACVQVFQSDENAKEGRYSLQMVMDLIGGDTNKSKGEVWVNMEDDPPNSELIPVDLTNRTITAWIYAPKGSEGSKKKPNGFQLFVKDENWNNEYGPWHNVVEGKWIKISLAVSTSKPKKGGYMDKGFDPGRIIAIGVKMGAGRGSTKAYKGPIYVDVVSW